MRYPATHTTPVSRSWKYYSYSFPCFKTIGSGPLIVLHKAGLKAEPNLRIRFGASGDTATTDLESIGTADPSRVTAMTKRFIDAGVELTMIESEGITENVKSWRTDPIQSVIGTIGLRTHVKRTWSCSLNLKARTSAGLLGFRLWLVTERTGLTKQLDVNEGPVDLCADAMLTALITPRTQKIPQHHLRSHPM